MFWLVFAWLHICIYICGFLSVFYYGLGLATNIGRGMAWTRAQPSGGAWAWTWAKGVYGNIYRFIYINIYIAISIHIYVGLYVLSGFLYVYLAVCSFSYLQTHMYIYI